MPYYNRYKSRVPTNKQLNDKIKKLQSEEELKYKDTTYAIGQVEADAFTVYPIGLVGIGTDARARIGDCIRGTSLKLRFQFLFTPNALLSSSAFLRMIVFYANDVDGVLPKVYNDDYALLDASSSFNPLLQQYNYSAMQDDFKVLHDEVFTMRAFPLLGAAPEVPLPNQMFFKKTIKLSRKTWYAGDNAVITDLESNGLFIAFYFDSQLGDPSDPNQLVIDGAIRMYYKDD